MIERLIAIPFKTPLWIFALVLTFLAYATYIKSMFDWVTIPHIFTRLLLSINAFIFFAAQQRDNGGPGTWATLFSWIISLFIAVRAFKHGARQFITKSDVAFSIVALIAIILWIFVKTPLRSVLLLATAELVAFLPTIRKSRDAPSTENILSYYIIIVRYIVAFFALTHYTIVTTIDLVLRAFLCTFFVIYLTVRRRTIASKTT